MLIPRPPPPPDRLVIAATSPYAPPGEAIGERVSSPMAYARLPRDFRSLLSDEAPSNVWYKGQLYRTVEHAVQAARVRLLDADLAGLFALDSRSPLSRAEGSTARKVGSRHAALLSPEAREIWESRRRACLWDLWLEKFRGERFAAALLGTGEAELWHGSVAPRSVRRVSLEEMRKHVSLFNSS